ncbi:NADH-quinone oxidoreductase subunit L [Flavitalea sp. BT771]|uniref:NADH-quinone oxidoreductase subunit L n=1 Tax=Flavitalea sp. BT771 TaxID=3063329 RepID=UPI0026E12DF7|nr:NADH-quinone oxidoreductase subunit L [Flavitalea sp. BT771]MDO6429072.1 NADH-quinone oxidoreductase subunit L [Flavitalea sp. BT771]MDV6218800.1 NADH-quinone oxidoreductase subunit L [Flavitalea sp. BT771]
MLASIAALPFLGFLLLSLAGRRLPRIAIAWIGAGSVSLAAILTVLYGIHFLQSSPDSGVDRWLLWQWFTAGNLSVSVSLSVDALSLVFIFIITFVGALIHIYSTGYMRQDRDYARFFACMNLFVGAMLVLVMADNLVLLYLGWEGVGMCSYLLIGFWYESPANCQAANKAFLVTRIGDTAMLIGLFLVFSALHTLNIPAILEQAPGHFTKGAPNITLIALLLLAGGMGKSAQLPLQTWLPDAMAGPSPVSALIHAATMVTAGVYLIARMHTLFQLAPAAMMITALVGGVTLFMAGCSAMVQTDIKRILAYSTISQIGYMFLALGLGAWSAAIFHFFTHAFFKALLFLAAGAVIEALHHEQDIFRMGGLKARMPLVFYTFLAGAAALAALPFVSAGFYSKDPILWYAWSSRNGNAFLWGLSLAGAFITAFYCTRLMLVVFGGEMKTRVRELPGKAMTIPLATLAVLSVVAGCIEWPHNLLHLSLFSDLIQKVLPAPVLKEQLPAEGIFQLAAVVVTLLGIYTGYLLYHGEKSILVRWQRSPGKVMTRNFLLGGWGFDQLYDTLFVQPFLFITRVNKTDVVDRVYEGLAQVNVKFNRLLSTTQNGSLRWYIAGVLIGILFIITLQLVL